MQKKVIRLPESDLHRIIKESVNNILTELDWKTYDNAARKRYNQWNYRMKGDKENDKKYDSYRNLLDAAKNSFKRDYGYSDENGYIEPYIDDNTSAHQISTKVLKPDGKRPETYAPYFITNQNFHGQNGQHTPGKWCVGTVGWGGAVAASPDFDTQEEAKAYAEEHNMRVTPKDKIDGKLLSKWDDANKELNSFYRITHGEDGTHSGDYGYQKGKGWIKK